MEQLLMKIINEAANKHTMLKEVALKAHDAIRSEFKERTMETCELRELCLIVFEHAMDTRRARLCQLGIEGMQLILRESKLHSLGDSEESLEQSLPMQMLHTLHCLPDYYNDADMQCHSLTIVLQLMCSTAWSVCSTTVKTALELCLATFSNARAVSVKMAARATASQILDSYGNGLYKELAEDAAEADYEGVYDEVTQLVAYCNEKLSSISNNSSPEFQSPGILMIVDALQTILQLQPISIRQNKPFIDLLWQGLCPQLVALMGAPLCAAVSCGAATAPDARGQRSVSGQQAIFTNPDVANALYCVCAEILRILAPLEGMNSVLEALFHRILLFPPVDKRLQALRSFKKILNSNDRVCDILIVGFNVNSKDSTGNRELALWKIVLDSLAECSTHTNLEIAVAAVQCCDAMLHSLLTISDEQQSGLLSEELVSRVNQRFTHFHSVDCNAFDYDSIYKDHHLVLPAFEENTDVSQNTPIPESSKSLSEVESETKHVASDIKLEETGNKNKVEGAAAVDEDYHSCDERDETEHSPTVTDILIEEKETDPTKEKDQAVDKHLKQVAERLGVVLQCNEYGAGGSRLQQPVDINKGSLSTDQPKEQPRSAAFSEDREQQFAESFIDQIQLKVTEWSKIKSVIELDQAVQSFASELADEHMKQQQDLFLHDQTKISVVNADAVYMCVFATLRCAYLLQTQAQDSALQTSSVGHLMNELREIFTIYFCETIQDSFVHEVLGSGCVVFATECFVRRIHSLTLQHAQKLLPQTSDVSDSLQCSALVGMIKDYDGSDCRILWDVGRLERAVKPVALTPHCTAARKLCRRLLTASWQGVVAVLSALVDAIQAIAMGRSTLSVLHALLNGPKAKYKLQAQMVADGLAAALGGLQRLAKLCNCLLLLDIFEVHTDLLEVGHRQQGLQSRSGWIFGKLVEIACPLDSLRSLSVAARRAAEKRKKPKTQDKESAHPLRSVGKALHDWPVHAVDVLSIDIVLDMAIEAGLHAHECWPHIIRCCEYVWELDRYSVGRQKNLEDAQRKKWSWSGKLSSLTKRSKKAAPKANGAELYELGGDNPEYLSYVQHMPGSPLAAPEAHGSVMSLLQQNNLHQTDPCEQLPPVLTTQVLALLVAKVVRLFDNVGRQLNLNALANFVDSLVTASQTRLLYSLADEGLVERAILLRHVAAVVACVARSGRPNIHIMRVWAIANTHFVEAACAMDSTVSECAVMCLHECLSAVLSSCHSEMTGYRFNEALLAPVQHALVLDMCTTETQDQLVCVVAELVHSHSELIGTGWRPLFGALKAVRFSSCAPSVPTSPTSATRKHSETVDMSPVVSIGSQLQQAVLDVFGSFLRTDNWHVFCMTAVDCINCLVHYLQQSSNFDSESSDEILNDPKESFLANAALQLLTRVHALLTNLFTMNRQSVHHMLQRLHLRLSALQSIEWAVAGLHPERVPLLSTLLTDPGSFFKTENYGIDLLSLNKLDSSLRHVMNGLSGQELAAPWLTYNAYEQVIVEAWFTLVEGLVGAVVTCDRNVQPLVLHTTNDMLEAFLNCPDSRFGSFCLAHFVLPMMQQWLRREARLCAGWRENRPSVRNFKQAIGLMTETVITYILADKEGSYSDRLLVDILWLHIECIAQPSEFVSRLGCSCLRHLLTSTAADQFKSEQWDIVCKAIWTALSVTVHPLRLLMSHFLVNSREFYGDLGRVQVALRKDSNPQEAARVRLLGQQVFLLDNQKFQENVEDNPDLLSQSSRSVILLLHSEEDDDPDKAIRLPFRDIVIGLLSHQLLLQLVSTLTLKGTELTGGGVCSFLTKNLGGSSAPTSPTAGGQSLSKKPLPGQLHKFTWVHQASIMSCLDASFQVGLEFDKRPGLKFLVKKVFNSTPAANLYKQTVTSWTLKAFILFEYCRRTSMQPLDIRTTIGKLPVRCASRGFMNRNEVEWSWSSTPDLLHRHLRCLADCYYRVCQQLYNIEKYAASEAKRHADALDANEQEHEPFVLLLASPEHCRSSKKLFDAIRSQRGSKSIESPSKEKVAESMSPEGDVPTNNDDDLAPVDTDTEPKMKGPGLAAIEDSSDEETVYKLVTTDDLSSLVAEYKRRKQCSTMPSAQQRENPFDNEESEEQPTEEQEGKTTEQEYDDAAMKDLEAQCLCWAECALCCVQQLSVQPQSVFRRLLPVFYPCVAQLAAASAQPRVRHLVADFLMHIDDVFDIVTRNID